MSLWNTSFTWLVTISTSIAVTIYAASYAYGGWWCNQRVTTYITVQHGVLELRLSRTGEPVVTNKVTSYFGIVAISRSQYSGSSMWRPHIEDRAIVRWITIPMWIPTMPLLAASVYCWTRARRRHGAVARCECLCCGYDCSTLGTARQCPECGALRG